MAKTKKETKKTSPQNKNTNQKVEKKEWSDISLPIIQWPFYLDAYAKSFTRLSTDDDIKREEELINQFLNKDIRKTLLSSLYNQGECEKLFFSQDLVNLTYWLEEDEIVDEINKILTQMSESVVERKTKKNIYNNTFQIISTLVLEEIFKRNEGDDLIIVNNESKDKNSAEGSYISLSINQVLEAIRQNINYTTKKSDGDTYLEIRSLQLVDFPTIKAAFRLYLKDLNVISYYLMVRMNNRYYLIDSEMTRLTNNHLYKQDDGVDVRNSLHIFPLQENAEKQGVNLDLLKNYLMNPLMKMMNLYNDTTFEQTQKKIFVKRFLSSLYKSMLNVYSNLESEVLLNKTNITNINDYRCSCDEIETNADLIIKLSKPESKGSNRLMESKYYLKFFNNGTLNNPASIILTTDVKQLSFIPHIDENGEKCFLPDVSESELEGHFNLLKRVMKNPNANKFLLESKGRLALLLDGSLSDTYTWKKMPEVLKNYYYDKCRMECVDVYHYHLDNSAEFFVENMLLDFNKYIFNNQF